LDDEQIVAQAQDICGTGLRWRRGQAANRLAEDDPGGAAQGGFQYLPACMNVLGYHGFRKV
jgi:hypothetical protein